MSREIKFRTWDKVLKEYLGFATIQSLCNCNNYLNIENHIFEQYTGLKDKNEVEIYEGDILRIGCEAYPIEVKYGKFQEQKKNKHDRGYYYIGFFTEKDYEQISLIERMSFVKPNYKIEYCSEFCEVIGNIHENPELLEECRQ
tara:strand:- start:1 stop:429 length:429 start_codon:yes stop_codon:yes gene_type:complete